MRFWQIPKRLRESGILGMNQRNADYIMRYNPRRLYPLVDDKLKTKRLAIEHQIAVPKLYGVVETQHNAQSMEKLLEGLDEFVIKPAHGSGGNGILVVDGRIGKNYHKPSGELLTEAHIKHHTSNILSGMYSLGGIPDKAIIEYRVQFDPIFEHITFQGVPDLRVIVFQGVPVTAMMRLPTRESDGKANLHQGAVRIGIDLTTGVSHGGVYHDRLITHHPDTGYLTQELQIPHWQDILRLSIRCAATVGLGYLGVDIVMDRDLGPLMLELNARPGLNVQLANQAGLLNKLTYLESLSSLPANVDDRMELAQNLSQQVN